MTRRRYPLADVILGYAASGPIEGAPALLAHGLRVDLFSDPAGKWPLDARSLGGGVIGYVTIVGASIPPFYGPEVDDTSFGPVYGRVEGSTEVFAMLPAELPQPGRVVDWSSLDGVPDVFPPEQHGHELAEVNGLSAALSTARADAAAATAAARADAATATGVARAEAAAALAAAQGITKASLGLGSVDNVSDEAKPVSAAARAAIAAEASARVQGDASTLSQARAYADALAADLSALAAAAEESEEIGELTTAVQALADAPAAVTQAQLQAEAQARATAIAVASAADRDRANHTGLVSLDDTSESATRVTVTPQWRTALMNATSAATANAIVRRDGSGDVNVRYISLANNASLGSHATRKDYVDAQVASAKDRGQHTGLSSLDTTTDAADRLAMSAAEQALLAGATDVATSNALVKRNSAGTASFNFVQLNNNPTASGHATRKAWVDSEIAAAKDRTQHSGLQTLDTTTDTATRVAMTPAERADLAAATDGVVNGALVRRSPTGGVAFALATSGSAPGGPSHLTRKDYVDALGTANNSGNSIVRRDTLGAFAVNAITAGNAPTAVGHLTRKDYVDGQITAAKALIPNSPDDIGAAPAIHYHWDAHPSYAYVHEKNARVGNVDPSPGTPGIWFQTGLGPDGNDFTMWIEDGL